jgi:hypothetical protein
MYSTNIGKTFLATFNRQFGKTYSAKDFFEKEFFPLFFDHPKYMLWHTNSPFVQMKKGQKPHLLTDEERLEKLNDLAGKISAGDRDASVAIGFPASEAKEFATTSGLVSDISQSAEEEDVYLSWIAAGLGMGIAGGYCIFLNEPDILLTIYKGWKQYRNLLNDPALGNVTPNKINTWNGQWVNYCYSNEDDLPMDIPALYRSDIFKQETNCVSINTVKWSTLYFNLSKKYPGQSTTGYIFSLGQTNKTLGFIPFHFKQARRLIDCYENLFGENAALEDKDKYEALFGVHIERACELGSIGLHALQPQDLKKYFIKGEFPNFKNKTLPEKKKGESEDAFLSRLDNAAEKDRDTVILFRTYKTWLVAMLTKNNEEIAEYSEEIAIALHSYRDNGRTNERKNRIEKDLLTAASKKKFINELAAIVQDIEADYLSLIKDLKSRVHLMTSEDFGYFIVLLRFDYAFQERNN